MCSNNVPSHRARRRCLLGRCDARHRDARAGPLAASIARPPTRCTPSSTHMSTNPFTKHVCGVARWFSSHGSALTSWKCSRKYREQSRLTYSSRRTPLEPSPTAPPPTAALLLHPPLTTHMLQVPPLPPDCRRQLQLRQHCKRDFQCRMCRAGRGQQGTRGPI